MSPVNKISRKEIEEYTFSSKEARDEHVKFMEMNGWTVSGQVKRLKENVSIMAEKRDEDYEWYAEFHRSQMS